MNDIDRFQRFKIHSDWCVKREQHSVPTSWIERRIMKGGWHIYLRAWCPNSKFRQTGHLHNIGKAKAVKPSLIYYQFQFVGLLRFYRGSFLRFFSCFLAFWINVKINSLKFQKTQRQIKTDDICHTGHNFTWLKLDCFMFGSAKLLINIGFFTWLIVDWQKTTISIYPEYYYIYAKRAVDRKSVV